MEKTKPIMNKQEIIKWLKKYNIINYTINDNLIVDVDYHVYLSNIDTLPFQFGTINNSCFNCSFSNLTSLKHCPTTVNGDFYCRHNNLTSLKHCPTTITGTFDCSNNNITSLKYVPFHLYPKLKGVDHLPEYKLWKKLNRL